MNELIYEYIRGSHLYGLATEKSDIDKSGVFLQPTNSILGLRDNYLEQKNVDGNDVVYYELGRWIELLMKGNPNMIEGLFAPDSQIIVKPHEYLKPIFDNKDKFLTKELAKILTQYAHSQIKKARGLNKAIVNPIEERKDVLDFCFTFQGQGSIPMKTFLDKNKLYQEYCGLVNIDHMHDVYGVYYDFKKHYNNRDIPDIIDPDSNFYDILQESYHLKGNIIDLVFTKSLEEQNYHGIIGTDCDNESNEVRLSSVEKDMLPICYMTYNKTGYTKFCVDYKNYQKWKKERNTERYRINTDSGKNYDCYLDDETEFLTNYGWKKYDDIRNDDIMLCFNKNRELKESPIISRTDKIYTGEIYTYEDTYTRFSITPNHKLFLSRVHRTNKNNFSCKYDDKLSNWEFIKVNDYFKGKYSHYHQVCNLKNVNIDNKHYSDDFIILLGMFLSEGCYFWNEEKKLGIRISQLKNRCGYDKMQTIKNIKLNYYEFSKRKNRTECTWDCIDDTIIKMLDECDGRYCDEKNIPKYVKTFSKRQFDLLLDSMICGDGTIHNKGHKVYYTTSLKMTKSLHTLLILNDYASQFYGDDDGYKYESKDGINRKPFYQVFISKDNKNFTTINKRKKNDKYKKTYSGWDIKNVENKRIVCFETNEHTLITRNKNKISFHGNSKNISNCIRLLMMGEELVNGKGFLVDRTNIDRDFILSVKMGEWNYNDIMEIVEKKKKYIELNIENCILPDKVEKNFFNEILIDIRKMFLK